MRYIPRGRGSRSIWSAHITKIMPWLLVPVIIFTLAACSTYSPSNPPSLPSARTALATNRQISNPDYQLTRLPSHTSEPTVTQTPEPTATQSPTKTLVPTRTSTATLTQTPAITATPTSSVPVVRALMRAFCRYGPGKAYLYSHELREGDQAVVDGRNPYKNWLWIKPHNLDRHCWVSSSVVEVSGDISTVNVVQTRLPHSTLYGPPENVRAERDGDQVSVSWSPVWMTQDDDRGYLIEATICQKGVLLAVAVHTDTPGYDFIDDNSCSGASGGKLYTVEKHGYTDPVEIPWP